MKTGIISFLRVWLYFQSDQSPTRSLRRLIDKKEERQISSSVRITPLEEPRLDDQRLILALIPKPFWKQRNSPYSMAVRRLRYRNKLSRK